MEKFRIKKGALLKIEGLPIMLSQDAIIVECETDITKTALISADVVKAHIEKISDVSSDYQQRVFDEASDLAKKIDKLRPFINSEKFASVDRQEQIRMIQQLGYMTSYLKILKDRMDSFK